MPLTKDDVSAIRNASDICVHLDSRNPQGLVRLIKRKPYNAKPFETDQEYVLAAAVGMETMEGRKAFEAGTAQCFAMAGIYHDQRTPVSGILKSLRVGDELTFSFYPDCHSNGYVAAAGLHADCLYLHVRRASGRQTWGITSSICPDNSARMCKGVPDSDTYQRQANEQRKRA